MKLTAINPRKHQ